VNEIIIMPEEKANDEATNRFLRTNGPPPFQPQLPEFVLHGADERTKWLCEKADVSTQQNAWQIDQIIGLKGAHRTIHSRLEHDDKRMQKIEQSIQEASLVAVQTVNAANLKFKQIDDTLAKVQSVIDRFIPFLEKLILFWEKWMGRKNWFLKILAGILTLLFLPFMSVMAVEVCKHYLGWK
jgi:hypothetical protein